MLGDNEVAVKIAKNEIKPNKSKSFLTHEFWIQDRVEHGQFDVFWQSGKDNLADFFTKVHPTKHFKETRSLYVESPIKQISIPTKTNFNSKNMFNVLQTS